MYYVEAIESKFLTVGVGNTALGFVGTCLSWPLMLHVSIPWF